MALWSLFMIHTWWFLNDIHRIYNDIHRIYNDIHSKFINIGLPTDPLVEDRVLVKQHYWLEWPYSLTSLLFTFTD